MSGVYNRKLFRQSNSRNSFQGMGGIMSSSNELMQQAMQTANNAPMPSDLGPLQLQPQAAMPPPPAPETEAIPYDPSQAGMPPPDQGMPAGQAPPDPMGQMQGQAPMDPMQQQPMGAPPEQAPPQEASPMQDAPFMPPGTPPSVAGYQDGGFVLGRFGGQQAQAQAQAEAPSATTMVPTAPTSGELDTRRPDAGFVLGRFGRAPGAMADPASRMLQGSQGGESFFSGFLDRFKTTPEQLALEKKRFDAVNPVDMALLQAGAAGGFVPDISSDPPVSSGPIDIGVTAGTVETPKLTADAMAAIAAPILAQIENKTPEETAMTILAEAEKSGIPTAGDPKIDLTSLYSELTGDPEATNKTIDDLNRGILGAAIAAGKSPRATENIANGMLVGLQAMKDTEEKRAAVAAQAQYGLLTAALTPKSGANGLGSRDYRNPLDAYQEAYVAILAKDPMSLNIPEGMTQETYADQAARKIVAQSYTPEQLMGSAFEGTSIMAPAAPAGTAAPAAPKFTPEQIIASAKKALAAGNPRADVEKVLTEQGIDPKVLDE
jgi:hypothetical protein